MGLEVIKPSLPVAAIAVQPLVQLSERLGPELIQPSLGVDRSHYEAGIP